MPSMQSKRWGTVLALLGIAALGLVAWVRNGRTGVPHARPDGVAPDVARATEDVEVLEVEREEAPASERAEVVVESPELRLVLRRWPDGASIAPRAVEVERDGEAVPVMAEGPGRFVLARPVGDAPLVLAVPRYERETVPSSRWQGVEVLEVLLRPVEGLFGRVVEVDGTPAAGVPVVAMRSALAVDVRPNSGKPPRMRVHEKHEQVAVAFSDANGGYRLDVPTRAPDAPLLVRAAGSVGRIAELVVDLPREVEPLPDLVLGAFPSIDVLVRDESGAPLAGVGLDASLPTFLKVDEDGEYALRTDAEGRCSIPAWSLPTTIRPMAPGWQPVGMFLDGREARPLTPVERVGQELIWVLRRAACVDVRLQDARTGEPLHLVEAQLHSMREGRSLGDLQPLSIATDGTMCFGFFDESSAPWYASEAPDYDAIEVSADVGGYEPLRRSVSRAELPPGGTVVLELEPSAMTRYVTGRVLDAGAPVALARVAVAAAPGAEPGRVLGGERSQGETDLEGRFSLLWAAAVPEAPVIVQARGPLGTGVATSAPMGPSEARDLTLEFEPSVDVLVRLAGARPGDTVPLRVEIESAGAWQLAWDTQVHATHIDAGELGATLALPARRPSRVSLRRPGGAEQPEPAVFDPASSQTSIRIDVSRPRAFLRGRAVVPVDADPREHSAVLVPAKGESLASAIDAQGGFAFEDVTSGRYELFLVRSDANGQAQILGRLELELDGDRDDVVLAAD